MNMKDQIKKLIESIQPFDSLEAEHITDAIEWIDSGVEIFRIEKPAIPPKHLVSYFIILDLEKEKIMLVDHIKAELWLPPGGHVEKDEDPKNTVEREIQEELNMSADFVSTDPFFITQAVTVGKTAGHTDVSLWYVLKADSEKEITYDPGEFNRYKWFDYEEILNTDISKFDPHMHRFTKKLLKSQGAILQFGEPFEFYKDRPGAYVVIFNSNNQVLTVATERGPYLPGGGIDPGESEIEALKREVFEETGFTLSEPHYLTKANQFAMHPRAGAVNKLATFYIGVIDQNIERYSPETRDNEASWMKIEDYLNCKTDEFHQYAVRKAIESKQLYG